LLETHKILSTLNKEEAPTCEQLSIMWSTDDDNTKHTGGVLDQISQLIKDDEDNLYDKMYQFIGNFQIPDNRKNVSI